MLLKVKILNLLAGKPVAILHQETSKRLNLHVSERLKVRKLNSRNEIVAVIDIVRGLIEKNEIALSQEIVDKLKLKKDDIVEVHPALSPLSINYIIKKLNNNDLTFTEIYSIVSDIVNNALTEAEVAYFVSAIYLRGMSVQEIISLTKTITLTGNHIKFNNKIVFDKHSCGGIAGNRTTPIIVSLIASAIDRFKINAVMPKTSSRAITSAAGTADVIETLAKVEFTIDEIKKIVNKCNACFVWGGALGLAPADDKIIQVERLLSLDPESQLIASIIAKKLSVNATHVVIDIPYGNSAKVTKANALNLRNKFEKVTSHFNLNTKILITDGNEPIGDGVGPILEMRDVISVLKQEKNLPAALEKKSIFIASELLGMALKIKNKNYLQETLKRFLESGIAYEKFRDIIELQGGNLNNLNKKLQLGKFRLDIKAKHSGAIAEIDNKKVAYIARIAGCPSDASAGIFLKKHVNDKVKEREPIFTIYAETKEKLEHAKIVAEKILAVKIK